MKAIIVDDEPRAIELLKGYLTHFNAIELVATFRNGLKAFELLTQQKIDLVLLDINMPYLSGISLSKMIGKDTKVIFTTAHPEFAVESYEVQALDYLLKPISFERFSMAITKLLPGNKETGGAGELPEFLLIKSGSKMHRIKPADILYLEKEGNYMTYHLVDQKIMSRSSIAAAMENLPAYFLQIHKSFVVNTLQVTLLEKDEIVINHAVIPIGATYKEQVMKNIFKQ